MTTELEILEQEVLASHVRMAAPEEPEVEEFETTAIAKEGDSTAYNVHLNFGGTQQPTANGSAALPLTEEQKQKRMIIAGVVTFSVLIILIIAVSMFKKRA